MIIIIILNYDVDLISIIATKKLEFEFYNLRLSNFWYFTNKRIKWKYIE